MNWVPVYALLLFLSTLITYLIAILIAHTESRDRKKGYLVLSLVLNFGILFFFKYYNFINEAIFEFLGYFHLRWEVPNLYVLLPVGISFYIFQAVGYSIDVYRGDIPPQRHFGIYALFVSFFPQLVAGPIERAKNLLPQFYEKHHFVHVRAVKGLKLMLWGYFLKLVVADRLALYVDSVYNNLPQHDGSSVLLATFFFNFQIYGDFAGYSFIAIGAAKIMGFDLMDNFRRPYFSKSISEFWSRWHISLSTWFRDYLYISLGGNRVTFGRWQFNLLVTFLVSGIWHGANWTFIFWGTLHGLFLIFGNIRRKFFPNISPQTISYKHPFLLIAANFILVTITWIFFRANSLADALLIFDKIFSMQGNIFMGGSLSYMVYAFSGIMLLVAIEYTREFHSQINLFEHPVVIVRYSSYTFIVILILSIGVFDGGQFIYFQF
jgi:D-alanyl-lipoteichoic acid acyltransferase DltB (MBOAT superfamily)